MNYLETTWRLFAATGQVNVYLLYKELEQEPGGTEGIEEDGGSEA